MIPELSAGLGTVVSAATATGFWGCWLAWSLRQDRRRLRNGFLLMAVVYTGAGLVSALVSLVPGGAEALSWVTLALLAVLALGLLALPVFLVLNGVTMVRRERRSLPNMLSLLAGLAMLAAPVVALVPAALGAPWALALTTVVLLATAWLGFSFLGFVAQTLLYRRYAARVPAHAVVVLGSRVVGGRVPPLLAARLTTALEAATRLGGADGPVPVVPSGGQGADEDRPEGVAMAEWLSDQGVPAERILVEDRARTTRENLANSVALLRAAGVAEPYLLATNDYHAPRAALEAMDLGLEVHAVGAPTAGYYFPSAYLREFVAVVRRRRAVHLGAAASIVLAGVLVLFLATR
ncbi:YdcF family protein [Isoptericola sp. NEAU-Y5]|uniref:YdcF family protein n=1 Tax=Isoptericola luteus TaxID=2879484 RepID=A0ABS7ZI54_9MICO|nr:YdcF family protein [Isoptericola sp. NEAU-Y5]MCA5894187.1 YdcF family protein [Isoptericola sp. NEAU-Y5]